MDTYNTLTFYKNGQLVATFTGSDVSPNANGNWTAPSTNEYVNILNLPDFNSYSMSSSQFAFEADNIAVERVPEPVTLVFLGCGLLGLAAMKRRFKK